MTIGRRFPILMISVIMSSNTIKTFKILIFLFVWTLRMQKNLSIFGWLLIRLSSTFLFPDKELSIFSILYRWSGTCGHYGLCSPVISSKLIIIFIFSFGFLINSSLHTVSGPIPYGHEIIQLGVCILISRFTLTTTLLIYFVNTLFNSVLHFCCDLVITLLLFRPFL